MRSASSASTSRIALSAPDTWLCTTREAGQQDKGELPNQLEPSKDNRLPRLNGLYAWLSFGRVAHLHGCIYCRVPSERYPVDSLGGRPQVGGDDQALEAIHKLRGRKTKRHLGGSKSAAAKRCNWWLLSACIATHGATHSTTQVVLKEQKRPEHSPGLC
jgi:hypothetical protein